MKLHLGSFAFVFISMILGGVIGYLDAHLTHDEYISRRKELIQNELYALDNQIGDYKKRIHANSEIAFQDKNRSKTSVITFCDAVLVPVEEPDMKSELSKLQKKEKKIWKYTSSHESQLIDEEKLQKSISAEWVGKLIGKASELRKKRKEAAELIHFWSEFPTSLPEEITVFLSSYEEGAPEVNPLHFAQINGALSLMPADFDKKMKIYLVYGEPHMRRGSAGPGVIFLKGEEPDIFSTVIHEFGHLYDFSKTSEAGETTPFHNGIQSITTRDPSYEYYTISWQDNENHRGNTKDFCSCYGSSSPQEDFAEAFAMYVLQGKTFAEWSKTNPVIKQKHEFLKKVFGEKTFSSGSKVQNHPFSVIDLPTDLPSIL